MMEKDLLKPTGEPDAGKLARPVRRGLFGKVPEMVTRWAATLLLKGRGKTLLLFFEPQWPCPFKNAYAYRSLP